MLQCNPIYPNQLNVHLSPWLLYSLSVSLLRLGEDVCVERRAVDNRIFRSTNEREILTFGRDCDGKDGKRAGTALCLVDVVKGRILGRLEQAIVMEEAKLWRKEAQRSRGTMNPSGSFRIDTEVSSDSDSDSPSHEPSEGHTAYPSSRHTAPSALTSATLARKALRAEAGAKAMTWVSAVAVDEKEGRIFVGSLDGKVSEFGVGE